MPITAGILDYRFFHLEKVGKKYFQWLQTGTSSNIEVDLDFFLDFQIEHFHDQYLRKKVCSQASFHMAPLH